MGRAKSKAYGHLIVELYKIKWSVDELTFREVLQRLYVEEGKSIRDLAKEFNVSTSTVFNWIKEEGITTRKIKC